MLRPGVEADRAAARRGVSRPVAGPTCHAPAWPGLASRWPAWPWCRKAVRPRSTGITSWRSSPAWTRAVRATRRRLVRGRRRIRLSLSRRAPALSGRPTIAVAVGARRRRLAGRSAPRVCRSLARPAWTAIAARASRLALSPLTEETILPASILRSRQHGGDTRNRWLSPDDLDTPPWCSFLLARDHCENGDPVELYLGFDPDDVANLGTLRQQGRRHSSLRLACPRGAPCKSPVVPRTRELDVDPVRHVRPKATALAT